MMAATSRIWLSPAVKADLVRIATVCPVRAGRCAMSLPVWPDCTAPATWAARPDMPGTVVMVARTWPVSVCENRVPSTAMPVAMPT